MGTSDSLWLGGIVTAALVDYYVTEFVEGDVALSDTIRRTFRTHTPWGRYIFLASVGLASGWASAHILRKYGI